MIEREPRYQTTARSDTFKAGLRFQKYAQKLLNPFGITTWNFDAAAQQLTLGENAQGVEYKFDKPCTETGQLSMEVAEKTDPANLEFVYSGILTKDNAWLYVQGNRLLIFVFSKKLLQAFFETSVTPEQVQGWPRRAPTVQRFFLPFERARRMAALVIDGRSGVRLSDEADFLRLAAEKKLRQMKLFAIKERR